MRAMVLAAVLALSAGVSRAEVVAQGQAGFTTRNAVEVAASAEKAFAALGEVGRWWNPTHSYSGKAENLSLELKPGACFCEALPGGGVRHAVVALAMPPSTLRLDGALGPLQAEGVSGALTFEIKPKGAGVEVVQTYKVGGAAGYAAVVDQVLAEQLRRFERYLETGRP
jgi:hypothetical protein